MTATAASAQGRQEALRPWWRRWDAGTVRTLRLASGLVLFTYVTLHLINHSLGLISLDAMNDGLAWMLPIWRNPAGTSLLLGSLIVHGSLALWAIYQRRRFNLPAGEWVRLILGLSIVPLMALHIVGTRIAAERFGTEADYSYVLLAIWVAEPMHGLRQATGLVVAWVHGCIGLHLVWRLKPWYPRAVPYLYGAAVLLPVLALVGAIEGGRMVALLAQEPEWIKSLARLANFPNAEQAAALYRIEAAILWAYTGLVAAAFAARGVRSAVERRRGLVRVAYPDDRVVQVPRGASILEASRLGAVPHAEVCGGRGRCSTCRVRIAIGLDRLPSPSDAERKVLDRIAAAPNVRLACQTRPLGDVTVLPLLPPTATARDGHRRAQHIQGQEREIAILFADLRAFTRLAEKKLPYDVVFLLNRYFAAMGGAVEKAGGRVDKFIGDGVMALFGVEGDAVSGCRQALAAARGMAEQLDELNKTLSHDLDQPLRIGIGVHVGPAIVGEMGYASATTVTAIGDAVNTASRLETLTKDYACQLIVSDAVAARAGVDLSAYQRHDIEVRGRREMLMIRVVPQARELPAGQPKLS